jgi:hypothetical protein
LKDETALKEVIQGTVSDVLELYKQQAVTN